MFFRLLKVGFFIIISILLYLIAFLVTPTASGETLSKFVQFFRIIDFIAICCFIHIAFYELIDGLIKYFNNIIILSHDNIVVIKCSLITKDDIEVIDAYRIVKVDSFANGFIQNIFGFGDIVIEQQQNQVKTLHYIPKPHKFLTYIKDQRTHLLNIPLTKD